MNTKQIFNRKIVIIASLFFVVLAVIFIALYFNIRRPFLCVLGAFVGINLIFKYLPKEISVQVIKENSEQQSVLKFMGNYIYRFYTWIRYETIKNTIETIHFMFGKNHDYFCYWLSRITILSFIFTPLIVFNSEYTDILNFTSIVSRLSISEKKLNNMTDEELNKILTTLNIILDKSNNNDSKEYKVEKPKKVNIIQEKYNKILFDLGESEPPYITEEWLLKNYEKHSELVEKINGVKSNSSIFLKWPIKNSLFLIGYVFFIGVISLFCEKNNKVSSWIEKIVRTNTRFAHLYLDGLLFITLILSFRWLVDVSVNIYNEKITSTVITKLIYYNLWIVLPLIGYLPALLITTKIKAVENQKGDLIAHFVNFYKILFIENPVMITSGIVLLLLPIGLTYFNPLQLSQIKPAAEPDRVKFWILGLELSRVIAPVVLLMSPLAVAIKNYDRLLASEFQKKLCYLLSMMHEHIIIMGYGYLGKDVLKELKERDLLSTADIGKIIMPTLGKRSIYKNTILVDKESRIFSYVVSDPVLGNIGVVESELDDEINPDFTLDEFVKQKKNVISLHKCISELIDKGKAEDDIINDLNSYLADKYLFKKLHSIRIYDISDEMLKLLTDTKKHKKRDSNVLTESQINERRRLNRLLMEQAFPGQCPSLSSSNRNESSEFLLDEFKKENKQLRELYKNVSDLLIKGRKEEEVVADINKNFLTHQYLHNYLDKYRNEPDQNLFSEKILKLIKDTKDDTTKKFQELNKHQQNNRKLLIRLLLQQEKPISENCPELQPNKESMLIAGIIGDAVEKNTIERALIDNARMFISTISDYEATNELVKYLSDKKCSGIITVQDYHQYKLLLPEIVSKESEPLILLHTSYSEGVALGRAVFLAAINNIEKNLPSIFVIGSGKQIYYLAETYLLGLLQVKKMNFEDKHIFLEIYVLSDEDFFLKNSRKIDKNNETEPETQQNEPPLDLSEVREWSELVKLGAGNGEQHYEIMCKVIPNKPDYIKALRKISPSIIVVSHKRNDQVIKLLNTWIEYTKYSRNEKTGYPLILVGTKGKQERVLQYLKAYKELPGNNNSRSSYPTQEYDAMVPVYDDVREQIGGMAEAFIRKGKIKEHSIIESYESQVCFYFSVKNKLGSLRTVCNRLAGLKHFPKSTEFSMAPSFLNTRIYRCPGEQIRGREGNHNQRFLIESDVVLQQISTGEKDNADDIVVCKGLVLPKKAENTINNLLGISHCGCLDKNCRFRELCRHSGGNQDLEDGNPSSKTVSDKSIAPLAKLSLCADSYNVPGSIAHVLNNLLFSTTSLKEKEPDKLVDLTFAKSYYSLNEKMHLKEFFGNVVKIKEGKREEKFKETFISYISIYPIVGNDKWKNYREALEGFLTKECGFEAKADGVDGDSYKIKSESHTKICSGTCPLACRDKVCRT